MTTTIPDLPTATSLNLTDQFLVRQPAGALGVDKKVTLALLQNIDLTLFSVPPISILSGDLMMLSQGGINYKVAFQNVGFVKGTKMWFCQDEKPDGWSPEAFSDSLLAVKGGLTYTTGGAIEGDWTLPDYALLASQLPDHVHDIKVSASSQNGSQFGFPQSGSAPVTLVSVTEKNADLAVSQGSANASENPQGLDHNHGDTFRPESAVGIICSKD